VLFALPLALAIDVALFVWIDPEAEPSRNPFFINHGSHGLPFTSPNLISTTWVRDMWLLLPAANAVFAAIALAAARMGRGGRAVPALILALPVVALSGLVYASIQVDLRL